MPFVPTTVSSTMAAIVWAPSTMITSARWARARSHFFGVVGGVERRPVGVRTPELDDPGQPGSLRPAPRIAGHRDRPAGRAVVAAVRRQHLVPSGVAARHADGVLGRLGTAVGEEHLVEVARRQLGDQPGRLAARVVGVDRGDRAQLVGLLLDRRHELGVLVADVDVDELAGEVEPGSPALVPEPRAEGPGDDDGVEQRLRRPRVEDVGAVVAVGGGGHRPRLFDLETVVQNEDCDRTMRLECSLSLRVPPA